MDKLEMQLTVEQLDIIMSALGAVTAPYQQLVQNLYEQANRQLNPVPTEPDPTEEVSHEV